MLKYYSGIGSRETPAHVCAQMTTLAGELRERGWILRSGHAPGADQAFERGAGELSEIVKGWPRFEGYDPRHLVLTEGDEWYRCMLAVAEHYHPEWGRVTMGGRALMIRNGTQIYGYGHTVEEMKTVPWSKFVVCWAELDRRGNPRGGTAQAIRIAQAENIPVFNLFDTELDLVRKYIENIERKL